MRKKFGILLMGLGLCLILTALGFIARNQMEDTEAAQASAEANLDIRAAMEVREQSREPEATTLPTEIHHKELPVEEVKGYGYIGTLGLPVLELDLPIMDHWSYPRLRRAPCRESGTTAYDMVIAGHNYSRHFGRLKTLVPGDPVTFTDMDGEVTAYEVGIVDTIQPGDRDKVMDEQWDLVLYTCTYGGRTRIMVGCIAL